MAVMVVSRYGRSLELRVKILEERDAGVIIIN